MSGTPYVLQCVRQRASLIRQIPTTAGFEFLPVVGVETWAAEQHLQSKTTSELQFCPTIRLNYHEQTDSSGSEVSLWHGILDLDATLHSTIGEVPGYLGTWNLPKAGTSLRQNICISLVQMSPSDAQAPHLPTFPPYPLLPRCNCGTGCLARQEGDWTPDPRPRPLALPCFLPRLQGTSGQSDLSASSTQSEPQTLACPPSRASSNDTCSAPPKHRRLRARQLYPPASDIPSFDLFPVKSCQVSSCQLASAIPSAHPACALAVHRERERERVCARVCPG